MERVVIRTQSSVVGQALHSFIGVKDGARSTHGEQGVFSAHEY